MAATAFPGLFAEFFFYGLNASQLYRTEGLRAIVAQEFLRSGNWIVPTLYGEPLLTKPPGMYAAIALVSWPFGGVSEWTARLPAALAAMGTVALFSWYFRRELGPKAGWISALFLPMSLMWLDKATTAEIDMLQVFWVTAAIICFLRALESAELRDARPALVKNRPEHWERVPREGQCPANGMIACAAEPRTHPLSPRLGEGSNPSSARTEWLWWLVALCAWRAAS